MTYNWPTVPILLILEKQLKDSHSTITGTTEKRLIKWFFMAAWALSVGLGWT